MPKTRWQRTKGWKGWQHFPWIAALVFVGIATGLALWLGVAVWKRFPPVDPVGAWTLVAGLGALATAIATVAIAAFALRGLRSLKIARDEIVHRAKTDAKVCAIHRMEEIAKEIIPLNTAALDAMARAGIRVFLGATDRVKLDPDPTDLTAARGWRDTVPTEAYNRIVALLNRLEAWSVYFTSGVADADVAFGPIAPLLRAWVGQYYAILLVLRSGVGPSSGRFPNLVQLYGDWSARMDMQQLDRLHKDIAGQMEQAEARLEQSRLPTVVPRIGS